MHFCSEGNAQTETKKVWEKKEGSLDLCMHCLAYAEDIATTTH